MPTICTCILTFCKPAQCLVKLNITTLYHEITPGVKDIFEHYCNISAWCRSLHGLTHANWVAEYKIRETIKHCRHVTFLE